MKGNMRGNGMSFKWKRLARLLKIEYKEFMTVVKSGLESNEQVKFNGNTLRITGEFDNMEATYGRIYISESDGTKFILSDAFCYNDVFGRGVIFDGGRLLA